MNHYKEVKILIMDNLINSNNNKKIKKKKNVVYVWVNLKKEKMSNILIVCIAFIANVLIHGYKKIVNVLFAKRIWDNEIIIIIKFIVSYNCCHIIIY